MYKALDVRDKKEIVILNPKWLATIDDLRELGRQDLLVCQGCKQPVIVRAGIERREHFAHKHLANCDYREETANLRNARAVLYEWLVSKFGENVSIEKKIDGINLFRYVDCWVVQGSKVFAYWIFDSTLKPEKRELLKRELHKLQININWIFIHEMLHIDSNHNDRLLLSTTEREFIQESKYDSIYAGRYNVNGSLHYLDSENKKVTSFRSLYLYHHPQVYNGIFQSDSLENVLVSPENGEFVYKDEVEGLRKFNTQQLSIKRRENQSLEIENKQKQSVLRKQDDSILFNKTGKCKICGQTTNDWLTYFGATGECICRSCSEKEQQVK